MLMLGADAGAGCCVLGTAQAQGFTTLVSVSCSPPTGLWNKMFPKREERGRAVLLPLFCSVNSGNMDTLETWLHPIQSEPVAQFPYLEIGTLKFSTSLEYGFLYPVKTEEMAIV